MKKVLITGAHGQLGCELKKLHPLFPRFNCTFIDVDTLDLTRTDDVRKYFGQHQFNYVINCAAYTAVDKAESEPDKAFGANAGVSGTLQEICTLHHCRLIHISTDYVFDGNTCLPYSEDDRTSPQSVYGKSKLAGEMEVLKNPLNIIIRTSWLYSGQGHNFLKTMLRLGKEKDFINVVYDQIGTPTSAEDLASAILTICDRIETDQMEVGGIFHFSNEGVCSWYDFATEIMAMTGLKCNIIPITSEKYPTPVKRPAYSVLNKGKIKSVFGLEIPHWRKSLGKVITSC
jgi:dTDP-4-dehydrorhamnose reductase